MATAALGPHERKPELRALTGLRAVAAIAVVISHVGVPKSLPEEFAKVAHWGYIGVPLFFMLSGVVLGYNYPELSFRQTRRTIKFYIARIARVMPLYWVMVVYCALFYFAVDHRQYPWAFVQNMFAVQTWGPDLLVAQSYYNGPGWSIGVELFFYLLFPFLVPVVARVARQYGARGLALIVAVSSAATLLLYAYFLVTGRVDLPAADPGSAHRWLYRNPLCQLPLFVCGLAIAFLLPYVRNWTGRTHQLIQTGVVVYVLALAAFRGEGGPWGAASYGAFFVLPFTFALLSLGSDRGWFARFLGTRPMVALGVASFALYLTHRWLVWQLSSYDPIAEGRGWAPYAGFVLTVAVLLLVGEGAHRYVEEPARRWIIKTSGRLARRFPARIGQRRADRDAAPEDRDPADRPARHRASAGV
jgi:peptidoglycan/LPS O-acetylase OafA/YrhL